METAGILVIDDEPDVLDLMVDCLESEGYFPVATTDSRHAVKLMDLMVFDVVVADVMMPHLDGLEILEVARRRNPRTEVLLVTGYTAGEIAREAWRKGACGFLEKPWGPAQFLGAFRQALWRARMALESGGSSAGAEPAPPERWPLVDAVVGGAAHEFGNLLTIIRSSAQFLLADLAAGGPRRSDVERIETTVERGRRLVDELMALCGERAGHPCAVDLMDAVEAAARSLGPLLKRRVGLGVQAGPGLWRVHGDPGQIEHLIRTLLLRASAATRKGEERPGAAQVTLELANVELREAGGAPPAEALPPGQYVMLSLRTGCEIGQAGRATATAAPGKTSALGLAPVLWAVWRHHGHARWEREPGGGSALHIYLPREGR